MKTYIYRLLIVLIVSVGFANVYGQDQQTKVADMSKEQIMSLTYDDLLQLSFEDLFIVSNKFGMSADELLEFFLNKDVTSASKRAEKSLNSPLSTTVISKEEIINSGATSIPDVLRLVPGMIVREKTPGNYDVHIRGNDNVPPKNMFIYSENAMSLVMIDSRPVYNYSFGGTFWESLPIDLGDVERIEIIRGPSSALYGPNAVTGAINIITKKPEGKKINTNVNAQIGNNNAKIANASVAIGATDKLKFRFSGNYTHLDRFRDDFYVFDLGQSFSKSVIDTMTNYWIPSRSKLNVNGNSTDRVPTPSLGTDKYGINGFAFYDLNKDVNVAVSFGLQQSDVITTTLGNGDFPVAGRQSNSYYFDVRSNLYGFQLQVNQMWGDQEIQKGSTGWYISPTIRNANLEYEKTILGTLTLRPGISYQQAIYSDQEHLTAQQTADHMGFLNGSPELNAISGFLRADYKLFDKLRLIAAIRTDKYNVPDKTYLTYQFISSYDINKTNMVRAVYSRANRGPFIVDSYANYDWQVVSKDDASKAVSMYPYTLFWKGNKNLKLPIMDMIEVGYRTQPTKNIMIDLEAFRTITSDYNYFLPDSLTLNVDFSKPNPVQSATGNVQYYNFDLKSVQTGFTAMVSYAVNKDLTFKVFGTIQQTKLENLYSKTLWNCFDEMGATNKTAITADGKLLKIAGTAQVVGPIADAAAAAGAKDPATLTADDLAAINAYNNIPAENKLMFGEYMKMDAAKTKAEQGGTLTAEEAAYLAQLQRLGILKAKGLKETYSTTNKDIVNGSINPDSLIDMDHKATPTFYGGASIEYSPIPKLHITTSLYYYTENTLLQTKMNDIGKYNLNGSVKANYNPNDYSSVYTVEPKFILNLKVSYKFWKECSIYVNSRNLLNSAKREFAYLDEIKGLYFVGLNMNF